MIIEEGSKCIKCKRNCCCDNIIYTEPPINQYLQLDDQQWVNFAKASYIVAHIQEKGRGE